MTCTVRLLAPIALVLMPHVAAAYQFSCTFDRECIEGEACAASGYELSVASAAADPSDTPQAAALKAVAATVDDITGSQPVTASLPLLRAAQSWWWESESGFHLLSRNEDGVARLSVHLPEAEMSILYLGRCEETN